MNPEYAHTIKIPALMFLNTKTRDGRIIKASKLPVDLPVPIMLHGLEPPRLVGYLDFVFFDGNVVSAAGQIEPIEGAWWPAVELADVTIPPAPRRPPRKHWWQIWRRYPMHKITDGRIAAVALWDAATAERPAWDKIQVVEIHS